MLQLIFEIFSFPSRTPRRRALRPPAKSASWGQAPALLNGRHMNQLGGHHQRSSPGLPARRTILSQSSSPVTNSWRTCQVHKPCTYSSIYSTYTSRHNYCSHMQGSAKSPWSCNHLDDFQPWFPGFLAWPKSIVVNRSIHDTCYHLTVYLSSLHVRTLLHALSSIKVKALDQLHVRS